MKVKQYLFTLSILLLTIITSTTVLRSDLVQNAQAESPVPTGTVDTIWNKNNNNYPTTSKKPNDNLKSLLQEHALMGGILFSNRYDNTPAFNAAFQTAEKNTTDLNQEIGSLYGTSAQNEFLPMWKNHITLLLMYTDALHNNDQRLQERANNGLDDFSNSFTSFANRYTRTNADIKSMIQQHIELEKAIIEAHAQDNYDAQYTQMHQAFQQAGDLADALVNVNATQ
jgi:hypothetical protein